MILGEKKKFSKHIIFFHYVKYIFKKKLKKIFLKTWYAKYSPRTFRIPCLTPHLHIHIIYKKAANISHTIPRTSYAKCSRTFRRPCPVKTGLRPPKYSHRTKSSVQYVLITYTILEQCQLTILTPPPHHHHQSRNDICTTQKKNFITNTHYYMWLNKFQTWKNFSHQQAYHILSTESSTNPIYKGLRFDMYLTGGHCSTARLVFWLGSGRIQSTCIDSTVCWFCYPCVNRVARHISTLL